jgi:N-acetylneuraminate synthase
MSDKSFNIKIPSYCKVIAEIGINHNGDIENAKSLIKMAKDCGCDAVKFQKRTIDIVYTKDFLAEKRESPWGNTQLEQKEGLEFDEKEYDLIDKFSKEQNIEWFASAWDIKSLEFLDKYKLKNQKIASAMITNLEFVNEVAKRKIHTYISTGMTNPENIENAVKIFKNEKCSFTLMHSVSTYPCNENDLNLVNIIKLKEKYQSEVGYSGHEAAPGPSIFAASLGANCIERHITLDRSMYGSDQSASLERQGLLILVDTIRKLPKIIGSERTKIYEFELPIADKLRYWQ